MFGETVVQSGFIKYNLSVLLYCAASIPIVNPTPLILEPTARECVHSVNKKVSVAFYKLGVLRLLLCGF